MKRLTIAVMLALVAVSGIGISWADRPDTPVTGPDAIPSAVASCGERRTDGLPEIQGGRPLNGNEGSFRGDTMKQWLALAILVGIVTTTETTLAQNFGTDPTEAFFRLSWNVIPTKRGRPEIEGYVLNQTGASYRWIELAIETIDADGRPLGTATVHVNSELAPYDRLYFESPLPAAGSKYRVTVRSYERFGGGAM